MPRAERPVGSLTGFAVGDTQAPEAVQTGSARRPDEIARKAKSPAGLEAGGTLS
jgi:hypothetical protein